MIIKERCTPIVEEWVNGYYFLSGNFSRLYVKP